MVTDRVNIAIAIKKAVLYWLSIGIFIFDLGQFKRSMSRLCIFLLQISQKLEHVAFYHFPDYTLPFV